jgi:DNA repair ATPase RecN
MAAERTMIRQNALAAAASVPLFLLVQQSSAQSPYDAEARTALANEINQTYGDVVSPSLSIAELFDIKNRLDKADSIAQKYSVDLDYRQFSFTELCDFESRIELANEINRKYGRNLDWKLQGYRELLQIDEQLRSEAQAANNSGR